MRVSTGMGGRGSPVCYHAPMTRRDFEKVVHLAIDALPAPIREKLENVQFTVAESPHRRQSGQGELYGLYEGTPFPDRGADFQLAMPDRITIFKRAIERDHRSRAAMLKCIQETVLHELGHYFGLDDSQLDELGYG